jgi:hypothetical protein
VSFLVESAKAEELNNSLEQLNLLMVSHPEVKRSAKQQVISQYKRALKFIRSQTREENEEKSKHDRVKFDKLFTQLSKRYGNRKP